MPTGDPTGQKLRFGLYTADIRLGQLLRNNEKVKIQTQPFQVLALLLERPGDLVSREGIKQKLWPDAKAGDFDDRINTAIKNIREALRDSAEDPQYVETVPKLGYRFIARVEEVNGTRLAQPEEKSRSIESPQSIHQGVKSPRGLPGKFIGYAGVALLLLALAAVGWRLYRQRQNNNVAEKDTVVLTDFSNSTGDPVFDDTLKTALSISLVQSHFFSVLPENQVAKILTEMALPSTTKPTLEQFRELCQRAGSKAYISGAIASLGGEYVLGLKAVNCHNGNLLAQEQATVESKERVVAALGAAASKLRAALGESLTTLRESDVPLERATTPSLEALKALTLGNKAQREKGNVASIPFSKRAIELDPNFALAYSNLAGAYNNLGESLLASENARKAFDLRERTTEREKYHIEAFYYLFVTGELEKARATYELWNRSYPLDPGRPSVLINLAAISIIHGQWDVAEKAALDAQRLKIHIVNYGNLGLIYLATNRLPQAKALFDEALAHHMDNAFVRQNAYFLAFLQGDLAEMGHEIEWAKGRPGEEDILLAAQADTEAYYGHIREARKWTDRAVNSAEPNSKETAALYKAIAAVREAEVGNDLLARRTASEALTVAPGSGIKILSALAFARAGDEPRALRLIQDLAKGSPADTPSAPLNHYWLPIIQATLSLRHDPVKALELLAPAYGYDWGEVPPINCLCSIYTRGEAYLQARRGKEAVVEFQKILDHRGIALNSIQGSLAQLGLARAYAMEGDTAKAKTSYQSFFSQWGDADTDVPILKEATTEYAKL